MLSVRLCGRKTHGEVDHMNRHSLALLLAFAIGACYYGFCSKFFFLDATLEAAQTEGLSALLGSALAGALVTPHIALGWIGVVLTLVAFLANSRGCALASVILYAVSAVLFFMYALFVVPEIVFSMIGYVRLKKINAKNEELEKQRAAAKAAKKEGAVV